MGTIAVESYNSGLLDEKIEYFQNKMKRCDICPKGCGIDRISGFRGFCKQGINPKISNSVLHFGEEPPISGDGGAGAIFFCGCTMACVYCQNFGFSQLGRGKEMSVEELGKIFLKIQEMGGETLDLITATPNIPGFLSALKYSIERGFDLPIVYNTSSYEKFETISQLDGIVDIYLADLRYTDDNSGLRFSGVKDYWMVAKRSIGEMFRQVGAFKEFDDYKKGLIIRYLILPNKINDLEKAADFIKFNLSLSVPVSLMAQYKPLYKAKEYSDISRKISDEEYEFNKKILFNNDIINGWFQDMNKDEKFRVKAIGI
jgi:putative pyruvate formate lyase activating enzyme